MSGNFDKTCRKRGFSLIVVLILSLVSLAILGVTLQHAMGSGGAGRISSSSSGRYNLLQNSVEEGRAELKRIMSTDVSPPRFQKFNDEGFKISAADDLLIDVDPSGLGTGVISRENVSPAELAGMGIIGKNGAIEVKIYDMQYNGDSISESITDAERKKLPPSIVIAVSPWKVIGNIKDVVEDDSNKWRESNTGVYLVRAALTVDGRESVIDTAVFQSNNAPVE
ncbi:MAG: hypothetical protein LBS53_03810 [Synergistaceae bacterium]|jgi:hypothetical protein|nr:hypothetical protein [Synergistaceae bacterium]